MDITARQLFQIICIIALNIVSCYFWLWLYKELFKKDATILEILIYGITSAAGALGIIRGLGLGTIISKASTEEGVKLSTSIFGKKSQSIQLHSDYVSYALICGIGFGIIENLIYVYYTFGDGVIGGISRILTNTILHALFSGIIGYSVYLYSTNTTRKKIRIIGIGIITGVGLHSLYNRTLTQSYLAISLIFIIGGYYILAFLLYQSDRLFSDTPSDVNGKM